MTMKLIALLALFPLVAFATDKPPPKPPAAPTQAQGQAQHQAQGQTQGQQQSASSEAHSSSSSQSSASASNDGVSQAVSIEDRKQAPSLAQGGLYLVGCGFSANAGGSQSSGAAFLGVQFITTYCRDQAQIANEAAFGNVKTACEMNRLTPAGQRNLKRLRDAGLEPELCPGAQPKSDPVPTVVVIEGESCATEKANRVLEKCLSK
jgi:hypothetical protein